MISSREPPYPGLRPFERHEDHLFFGRDNCVDRMIAKLAERRFLAVLGSSGTGKSSLVKTGLFSGLEMGLLSGAGSRWLIIDFKPGGNPLRNLAEALLNADGLLKGKSRPTDIEVAALHARFKQQGPRELVNWYQEYYPSDGPNLLVLVDQFEELFLYQSNDEREEAQALISLLLESRWPRGVASPQTSGFPIYVAITMRSEYLGACTLLQGLAEAINEGTFLAPRMTRKECEEAIIGPARVCGVEVEPRLVTRILNDLEDFAPWGEVDSKDQLSRLARRADQLPLMQHALNRMWHRASQHLKGSSEVVLKLADYRGLEQELDEHAEEVYGRLNASAQAIARSVFQAVTMGTTVANAVRRRTQYGNLVTICGTGSESAVAAVLKAFGPRGCQFLTSDRPQSGERFPDDAWIDIAHESLIRQWKRLSGWLEQEGRWSRAWQQLKDDAERGRYLSGDRLIEAVRLRKEANPTRAWAKRYGDNFDAITKLINWSRLRTLGLRSVFALVVGAALSAGYLIYQQHLAQANAKKAAVTTAQQLADHVSRSLPRGGITVDAAMNFLQVVQEIIEKEIKDIASTHEAIAPVVNAWCTVSDTYGELGNYTKVGDVAKSARDLTSRLWTVRPDDPIAPPNDPRILQLLYQTTWRIGDAIDYLAKDSAQRGKALEEYVRAKNFAQRLAANAPEDLALRRELMFIHQKIGDVYLEQNRIEDSIREFQTALSEIERVVKDDREKQIKWQRDAASSVIRIGRALFDKGDVDGALTQYRRALEMRTDLEKKDSSDKIVQSNLASNHRLIAQVYAHRYNRNGDPVDLGVAKQEYGLAIKRQEDLRDNDQGNATYQSSLAIYFIELANLLRKEGVPAAALGRANQAYAIREKLARNDPTSPKRKRDLALAAILFADLSKEQTGTTDDEAKRENIDIALKRYREAIDLLDETKPPDDRNVFETYIKIGDILDTRAGPDRALVEYKVAFGIALAAAASSNAPERMSWQRRLVISHIKMGDVLDKLKRPSEAISQYQKALEIVREAPQTSEWRTLEETLTAKIGKLASRP